MNRELIKTSLELCTGCNRCVRECPMELANIMYQDEAGNIKAEIDHEKCIACGRCLTACKHGARDHVDDSGRFFDDLKKGVPISIMTAPAIRTNMPEYKRLFTWFKRLGVKTIYDVSLGADICIWSNIRHVERRQGAPMIAQPCPVIVTYLETYRSDLLEYLSPAQSPMACAAVYMKEYKGIDDRIAAISPCVAKANEFLETGLADYALTFAKLKSYLEEHDIELPAEETDFDSDESSLGSIFPMPGGLKENIEFYSNNRVSVDRAEGTPVFKMLDEYAASLEKNLPLVFDVLNCQDGCNIGTACTHNANIFKINREMDNRRQAAVGGRERAYFEELYRQYDETFELSKFTRTYKASDTAFPKITEEDIAKAFLLLDKTDDVKQSVDCGACGSDTCRGMARKIALGVNIPINCIVKSMEDARTEHVRNVEAQEQLQTLEKLRESDERMRVMLDSTPIGAHFWDENRELIDCNREAAGMFGIADKQQYMSRYFELTPEYQPDGMKSVDKMRYYVDKTFEEGYHRIEWMRRSEEGELIPVETTFVRVNYNGRNVVAGYCRDLREQKRMMQEIERAQITTAAMFASNPQINVLFDNRFRVVDCNPAALSFLRVKTKEELFESFTERMTRSIPEYQPDGRPSISLGQRLMTAAKDGSIRFETELNVDGEIHSLDVEFIRIPYGDDFAIVGYIYDVTETHNREMELKRIYELNQVQLTKLNMAARASKIGLWDMEIVPEDPVNPCNAVTYSDEFRQLLGYSDREEFPDVFGSWSGRLHPDDAGYAMEAFTNHLFASASSTPYNVEIRLKKRNGDYAYFQDTGETIRDESGKPLRIAGALIDVTETKTILLDTERAKLEAEAASQAKSAFLSTMSHEIRTPMNAILGITEIQLQNESLDLPVREGFEKIYTSGDMLLGIINDILDLSRIEAGKLELAKANYETASLISDTAQLNMMRIGSKPINFELHIDENLPMYLFGDELRVKQVLNNLLSNAFKYTTEGTVKMSITLGEPPASGDEVLLIIEITDTGQGMTREQVESLFEEYARFNQDANRSTEGTGLGMSITRNLLNIMNGEIQIESEKGKGSVFTVTLPQGRVNDAVLGGELVDNLHQFRSSSRAQMRRVQITRDPMPYGSVLIVDDVETNIFVARGLLAPYSLKIDASDSGFEAIEKIREGREYDVIFMDHMMPKMDGVKTTGILRDMGYDKPIVALTANAVSGQAEIFLGNGFDDFISKPIDVRQLNTVLNKHIRDKQDPQVVALAQRRGGTKEAPLSRPPGFELSARYAEILLRDVGKSLAALEAFMEKGAPYGEEDIRLFTIHTHGMKSALANVGKMDISAIALKLEQLARTGNIEEILEQTPAFITALKTLKTQLAPKGGTSETAPAKEDAAAVKVKLDLIKAACEGYDSGAVEALLSELKGMAPTRRTGDLISKISGLLLHSDFDEISAEIDWYLT